MYNFDSIKGNELLKKSLNSAARSGSVNHAYIFSGSSGTGKSLCARVFAKALLCENSCACGVCQSCKSFDTDNNPDVYYIVPAQNKKTIGVDDIRSGVIKTLYERPFRAKYKIFIIDDAHIMTAGAQNALLKALEEPPAYGVFLITTDNLSLILPTVLSRTARFALKPLPGKTVQAYLDEQYGGGGSAAVLFSGGCIGRAIKLKNDEDFMSVLKLAEALAFNKYNGFFEVSAAAKRIESFKERFAELCGIMLLIYRDALVCKTCGEAYVIHKDNIVNIKKAAQKYSTDELLAKTNAVLNAMEAKHANANFTLNAEVLAMDTGC